MFCISDLDAPTSNKSSTYIAKMIPFCIYSKIYVHWTKLTAGQNFRKSLIPNTGPLLCTIKGFFEQTTVVGKNGIDKS